MELTQDQISAAQTKIRSILYRSSCRQKVKIWVLLIIFSLIPVVVFSIYATTEIDALRVEITKYLACS
jgi:TRAP-type mannitol/chloroaromatic compound transport system permease small subunit